MRSITDLIVRTRPDAQRPRKISGPVAMAVFVAVLAAGVTGGMSMLATAAAHHNVAAVQVAQAGEYE
jgi:hypothetical protein